MRVHQSNLHDARYLIRNQFHANWYMWTHFMFGLAGRQAARYIHILHHRKRALAIFPFFLQFNNKNYGLQQQQQQQQPSLKWNTYIAASNAIIWNYERRKRQRRLRCVRAREIYVGEDRNWWCALFFFSFFSSILNMLKYKTATVCCAHLIVIYIYFILW